LSASFIQRLLGAGQGSGLRAQLVRGTMGVGGLTLLSVPLTLATSILLARGLSPEGYGQYAFVISLITTLSIPLAPALMQLTTRETAVMAQARRVNQIQKLLGWANRSVFFVSIIIVVTVGGIAAWRGDWQVIDRWSLLLLGVFALPFLGLNAVRLGVLTGLRHVVLGQFPDLFIRPLILLLVASALLVTGSLTPLTAIATFIGGAAFAFIVGAVLLKRVFVRNEVTLEPPDAVQSKQWMRAWVPFTFLVAASALNSQVGILFLGWLSSYDQVAAMQVAERGAMMVNLSLALVNIVISPHITRAFLQNDGRVLQILSRQSARFALLAALPIALLLLIFGDLVISVLFGSGYAKIVAWPLRILVLAQLINVAFGTLGMFLSMTSFEKDTFKGNSLALLSNGVLCLILIPNYGALGASISASVALIVWNLFLAFRVYRKLGIRPGAL
jgi:O-antigen/teichoic acid export membrane protein